MTKPWEKYTDEIPDTLLDRTASFAYIQWVNDGNMLQPRQPVGGWAMPVDQAVDSLIPGEFSQLTHWDGTSTDVIYTRSLRVIPIRTRFCWIKDSNRIPRYEAGARGKLQVLCLTPDNQAEAIVGPYMLTVKGMTSKQVSEALKAHDQAVRTLTGDKGQPWMFWLTLSAGEIKLVGSTQQSPVTTVVRNGEPAEGDFIGDEAVRHILALADQAEKWVAAWRDEAGGPNGNGEIPGTDDDGGSAALTLPEALAQALSVRLPVGSASFAEGSELGALVQAGENGLAFLRWLRGQAKYPDAQKAATLILGNLTEAVRLVHAPPTDEYEDNLPF